MAAQNNQAVDVSDLLIAYGAHIDVVDADGNTPLHIVANLEFPHFLDDEIVQNLLDHGVDPLVRNRFSQTAWGDSG